MREQIINTELIDRILSKVDLIVASGEVECLTAWFDDYHYDQLVIKQVSNPDPQERLRLVTQCFSEILLRSTQYSGLRIDLYISIDSKEPKPVLTTFAELESRLAEIEEVVYEPPQVFFQARGFSLLENGKKRDTTYQRLDAVRLLGLAPDIRGADCVCMTSKFEGEDMVRQAYWLSCVI